MKRQESHVDGTRGLLGTPLYGKSQSVAKNARILTSVESREALAALYKEPSEEINSHEMAEFFLAPYKEKMKAHLALAFNTPLSAARHAAAKLHQQHAHHVLARVDVVQRLLEKSRSEVLRFVFCKLSSADGETLDLP